MLTIRKLGVRNRIRTAISEYCKSYDKISKIKARRMNSYLLIIDRSNKIGQITK